MVIHPGRHEVLLRGKAARVDVYRVSPAAVSGAQARLGVLAQPDRRCGQGRRLSGHRAIGRRAGRGACARSWATWAATSKRCEGLATGSRNSHAQTAPALAPLSFVRWRSRWLPLLGVGWLARLLVRAIRTLTRASEELASRAEFLDRSDGARNSPTSPTPELLAACSHISRPAGMRVDRSSLPDGRVDFDSQNRPEELENQHGRPEIHQALTGRSSMRHSLQPGARRARDLPGRAGHRAATDCSACCTRRCRLPRSIANCSGIRTRAHAGRGDRRAGRPSLA